MKLTVLTAEGCWPDHLKRTSANGSSSEDAFDNLARLAAMICHTPIAIINFMDQRRQWLRSRVGVAEQELEPSDGLCPYTILQRDVLVVPDTSLDSRMAPDSTAASAWGVRFYAGAPLVFEGEAVGTLCVMDRAPRTLSRNQMEALRALALQVVEVVELIALRTRVDEAARASDERDRLEKLNTEALRTVRDGFWLTDKDGYILDVSHAYCELIGYSREELLRMRVHDLEASESDEEIAAHARQIIKNGGDRFETRHRAKNGRPVDVEISANYLPERGGRFVAFIRDITERKRAEWALRQSEERYRAFIEQSTEGIWCFETVQPISIDLTIDQQVEMIYRHGYLSECNAVMAQMYGFSGPDDLAGVRLSDLLPPTDPQNVEYLRAFIRSSYRLVDAESREPDRYGDTRYFLNNLIGIVESGFLLRAWGTQRDITERKRAEEALGESERRYRELFEQDLAGVCISSPDGTMLACNPAFGRIFGFRSADSAIECNLASLYEGTNTHGELLGQLEELCKLENLESRMRRLDGAPVHVIQNIIGTFDESGQLVQVKSYLLDLTERKSLENQLRQAQKMEAVGRLAGGVAHDFNNVLTAIIGHSDLLLHRIEANDPTRPDIEEIRKAGERATRLTRQLLAFSRRQVLQLQVLDLNSVVGDMEGMLRRLIGEDIELVVSQAASLESVRADAGQMEQVIMNLAVNARDAMPTGGKLTIETANVDLDEEYARTHVGIHPGSYVMVAISDTGVGMDKETQLRIFEPFFTTKEPGKGTGLGLSTVYGIVKQMGGNVWVYSGPQHGTTFKIYLPRVQEEVRKPLVERGSVAPAGGNETILLVEDDEGVRGLICAVLKAAGYNVLEAATGSEALHICDRYHGPLHLIITDVVMPQMSGRELVGRLSALRPETKVLFISGYTDDAVVHHGVIEAGTSFLQKPFTPQALARKVRETLDLPHFS